MELEFLNLIINNNYIKNNNKIKIIISTSTHNSIFKKFIINNDNVKGLKLCKMSRDEILQFIICYLSQYGKVFDDKQKSLIIGHEKKISNPLFLTIFLEEIRCFGSFEKLNEYIESYINVKSITKLFEKVMFRLENEFKQFNNILINILCLLYFSRNGLFTNELNYVRKINVFQK